MPAWEDLTEFLQEDEFAVRATLILQAGTTRAVTGIFDDPYLDAQLGEYALDTTRPRFMCRMADVADAARGDELVIDGETFDVLTSPQGDGEGLALLDLGRRHA